MSERDLRYALVGEYDYLYQNNAWFKSSVDTLAVMLPFMVSGFAAEASEQQAKADAAFLAAMRNAGPAPAHRPDAEAAEGES